MAKSVNFTAEQTLRAREAYVANPTKETVEALAAEFGKSTRSIVAKLANEKVYKKVEYVSKAGATPVRKAELVDEIAGLLNVAPEVVGSLEGATKQALEAVINGLK